MSARGEATEAVDGASEGAAPEAGSFLGRWSRRKRADAPARDGAGVAQASPAEPAPVEVDEGSVPASRARADEDAGSTLTDADMPPLESLTGTSDVSAFLSRGVSASLRRAALRRVFRAPEFNVRDGLNDYDGDFTAYEPLGDTLTCDMKFRAARLEREAAEREAAERETRELEALERDAPADDDGVDERDGAEGPAARAEGDGDGDVSGEDGGRAGDRPAVRAVGSPDVPDPSAASPIRVPPA